MSDAPERPRLPLSVIILIGALTLFGALAAVQWVLGALFGVLRLGLVLLIIVAVAALVFRGGSRREHKD